MIYLASQSPRRKELLAQLGVNFKQFSVDIDETPIDGELPTVYVERLAKEKALAGLNSIKLSSAKEYAEHDVVIGSDTIVVINGLILGKPSSKADFINTMKMLSGNQHQVYTSVALVSSHGTNVEVSSKLVCTDVTFATLTLDDIESYWLTGEPQDKAGGYGIQGIGGKFVTQINGSYSSVVGLPLYEMDQLLKNYGMIK